MSDNRPERGKIEISAVIKRIIATLRTGVREFALLILFFVGLPTVFFELLTSLAAEEGSAEAQLLTSVGNIVGLVIGAIAQVGVILGSSAILEGGRMSYAEMQRAGLKRFAPFAGISICYGLGVLLTGLLFIIPGVMLATAWAVAPTVLVLEGKTLGQSFGRSMRLTEHNRWSVLGLLLLWIVIYFAFGFALLFILGLPAGIIPAALPYVDALSVTLSIALGQLIGAVGAAALYHELRRVKEGDRPEGVAAVFD